MQILISVPLEERVISLLQDLATVRKQAQDHSSQHNTLQSKTDVSRQVKLKSTLTLPDVITQSSSPSDEDQEDENEPLKLGDVIDEVHEIVTCLNRVSKSSRDADLTYRGGLSGLTTTSAPSPALRCSLEIASPITDDSLRSTGPALASYLDHELFSEETESAMLGAATESRPTLYRYTFFFRCCNYVSSDENE